MLLLGRALKTRLKLLLLDEPSIGLAPMLVHQISIPSCSFAIRKDLRR